MIICVTEWYWAVHLFLLSAKSVWHLSVVNVATYPKRGKLLFARKQHRQKSLKFLFSSFQIKFKFENAINQIYNRNITSFGLKQIGNIASVNFINFSVSKVVETEQIIMLSLMLPSDSVWAYSEDRLNKQQHMLFWLRREEIMVPNLKTLSQNYFPFSYSYAPLVRLVNRILSSLINRHIKFICFTHGRA